MQTYATDNIEEAVKQHGDGYLMMVRLKIEQKIKSAVKAKLLKAGHTKTVADNMANVFGPAAAEAAMSEIALVSAEAVIRHADMPAGMKDATTQNIINKMARPALARRHADAMLASGVTATTLLLPVRGELQVTFAGFAAVVRGPDGPISADDAEPLKYGHAIVSPPKMLGRDEGEA